MTDKEANTCRITQLRDDCLALEAQMWGKRMELAVATGQAADAQERHQLLNDSTFVVRVKGEY